MDVSIVVPILNEEETVEPLFRQIVEVMEPAGRDYEILFIDDGSTDRTAEILRKLAAESPRLRAIHFRRNFGQTAGIAAGFSRARGDVIVTLDADLQNDPADIPMLLQRVEEGYDVVSGWRRRRQDPFVTRRLPSLMANRLISKITGVALHDYGCTLKAYRREIVRNIRLYGEMHRFIPALASWVGGRIAEVEVTHHPRRHGTSKYGIGRTVRVLLDLITVKFLLRYSTGPIQIFGKIGLVFALPGGLILMVLVIGRVLQFWGLQDRVFLFLIGLLGVIIGMQFISMGLLAEIMTRTYHESQDKPIYVVREEYGRGLDAGAAASEA
jgi:glycosyltransferase involved in cell wall biosynthesis